MTDPAGSDRGEAVFVISGPSGAGKSTVGHLLAGRFARGVHIEGDIFRRFIVAGREEVTSAATPAALRQIWLRYEIAAAAADIYFKRGFTVVIEDVVAGPFLPEFLRHIKSEPCHLIVLMPSRDTVAARERDRGGGGYARLSVDELYGLFDTGTPRLGVWIDSTSQTPEQTVEEILRRTATAS